MYTDICKCICIIMINYAFIIFIYVPALYFSHMTIFYHIISCYCFFTKFLIRVAPGQTLEMLTPPVAIEIEQTGDTLNDTGGCNRSKKY